MAKRTTRTVRFKGDEGDEKNLVAVLGAVLYHHFPDGVRLSPSQLSVMDGSVGIRARYENDGSIVIWSYARIKGEN